MEHCSKSSALHKHLRIIILCDSTSPSISFHRLLLLPFNLAILLFCYDESSSLKCAGIRRNPRFFVVLPLLDFVDVSEGILGSSPLT